MEKPTDIFIETRTTVRFSEVDSLKIVWHGHYIRYFEDAREAFGNKYGIGYLSVYEQGFTIPIVSLDCNYKKPLVYGDVARITCRFTDTPAAKMIFHYQVFNDRTGDLMAEGKSIQVFLDTNGVLQLYAPGFFLEWKHSMGLRS